MTLVPALLALALGAPTADDPLVLEGVVRAPGGQPAPAARVHLATREDDPQARFAELYESTETDADGRFRVTVPERWLARTGWKELFLLAHSDGTAVAGVRIDVKEMPVGTDVVLRLAPSESTRVVVHDADGAPVVGARVTATSVPGARDYQILLPAGLAHDLAGATDGAGAATIQGVSAERVGTLLVESETHGAQAFHADFGHAGWLADEDTLTLQPTTRLVVEWTGDDRAPASAVDVRVRTYVPLGGEKNPNDRFVMSHGTARVGPGLPPVELVVAVGSPMIDAQGDDASVLGMTLERPAELEPGGTARLSLGRAEKVVTVSGRFVDASTGEGAGRVRALVDGEVRAWIETDEDGRFTVPARPPRFLLREARPPAGLTGFTRFDGRKQWPLSDDEDAFDLGAIQLAPTTPIRGIVRRPDGSPVPGAWVSGEVQVNDGRMITTRLVTAPADAEGRFVLEGVASDTVAELRAHHGGWFTVDAVRVAAGDEAELEIRELLAPRGRVVDGDGGPIPDATVEIWSSSPENLIGGERPVAFGTEKRLLVDADGTFAGTPALSPEKMYCAVLRSEAAELRRTEWFTGAEAARGLELDMRRLRTLRGRIVGPGGEPAAGVEVMVRGGNPTEVRATTDADGHFELEGVTPDAGFVFAEAEGRFHGTRFEAAGDLEWRLGSPSPEEEPWGREPAAPRELELEIARRLLVRGVDAAFAGDKEHEHLRSLQRMAWIDPAYVLDRLERGALKASWVSMVHSQVVQSLAEASPDEAQAVAEMIESSYSSAMATIHVADALPPEEHERKLELLALALAKTKQIQGPAHQLILYSWVAERLLDLGELEEAKDVFAQAIPIADDIPAEEWSGFARSSFAEELAQVDLDAALVYVDEYASADDRGRHYGNIAQELAASDPEKAEELLGRLKRGSWRPERYAPAICYEMAPVDLERARRIAEKHDPSGWSLGLMALALVDEDTDEARRLLVAAYERLEEHAAAGEQAVWNRDAAKIGAALLPIVEEVAPGELESYVWRALALRQVKPDLRYLSTGDSVMAADGALAFYVARYDRSLARTLLEPVVRHLATLDDDRGSEWGSVYAALAVVDPVWAAELAETALPPGGAKVIGAVLARDPKDRTDYVQEEYLYLWILGKEDI